MRRLLFATLACAGAITALLGGGTITRVSAQTPTELSDQEVSDSATRGPEPLIFDSPRYWAAFDTLRH